MQIGIDIVYIPEFVKKLDKAGGSEMVFTDSELAYAKSKETLAGIFASKEAFMKALGRKVDWKDVWVEHEDSGKPFLATTLLDKNKKMNISISHDGDYSTAIVVIE
ncbi:MAG: holo-ACP synthase [Patescibacteria group bacterium]